MPATASKSAGKSSRRKKIARTYGVTPRNLVYLARQLRAGELVAAPTETVYGLAANAFDARACRKIFAAKRRPATDPLIVHLHSLSQLEIVCRPNPSARWLAEKFWPGPLTLILPKTDTIPDEITAGRDSVAVRMPAHPVFRRLLKLARVPLAAPSANLFGYVSPTTAAHVAEGLGSRIHFILDGGPTSIGLESTILDLRDERRPRLLRPGAVSRQQLEHVLKRTVVTPNASQRLPRNGSQIAPGQLKRHYSPHTPIELHSRLAAIRSRPNEALVYFRRPAGPTPPNLFWLDAHGDLGAAGRRLFSLLRELDSAGFVRLHIELAPGAGLADAINDRLRRAAARG